MNTKFSAYMKVIKTVKNSRFINHERKEKSHAFSVQMERQGASGYSQNKYIWIETFMSWLFTVCAFTAFLAVIAITGYMVVKGVPAICEVGFVDFFFGTVWQPTAVEPRFGILNMILTTCIGTFFAILLGVPIGVLTAVFLAEVANEKTSALVRPAVELLAGIPSVIYGLLGTILIVPLVAKLELMLFASDSSHVFTGGANFLSGVLVLAMMVLPTIITVSETALRAVPASYKEASLALGATRVQTIFRVLMPAARSGIITAVVLGFGRAIGEAMAIIMVAGNVVNSPAAFHSVRFLTTGIVAEMGYASGLHREVLFSIGFVLFCFIMMINILLSAILRKGRKENER